MVDSEDVLKLGFEPVVTPIFGKFPSNLNQIKNSDHGNKIQFVLANSVIHYVKNDGLLQDFIESVGDLLLDGGIAYLGDVPTLEMKVAQANANKKPLTSKSLNDFTWLNYASMANSLSKISCSLYILPQPRWVPMHSHRSDLLIIKHQPFQKW
jgi:hypothetical protein